MMLFMPTVLLPILLWLPAIIYNFNWSFVSFVVSIISHRVLYEMQTINSSRTSVAGRFVRHILLPILTYWLNIRAMIFAAPRELSIFFRHRSLCGGVRSCSKTLWARWKTTRKIRQFVQSESCEVESHTSKDRFSANKVAKLKQT